MSTQSTTPSSRPIMPFPMPATYHIHGDAPRDAPRDAASTTSAAGERQVTFHKDGSYTVAPAESGVGDRGTWSYNAPEFAITLHHPVSPAGTVAQTWKFSGMTRDLFVTRLAGSQLVATEGDEKLAKSVPIPADAGASWDRDRAADERTGVNAEIMHDLTPHHLAQGE
ncbi:hypothetical protein H9P43_003793 [Blastocladiella emersonii ATCC 22665]|nr:hypothetical protein H9P43_003793 [Blastocladiella emersonii ATCC 22665]